MRRGAIVLFKNGYCYQSYGWNILRPLGKLQNVIDHLEEYQVDEISIIRPIKGNDDDKSFYSDMLELSKIKSSTPLNFGGGLYNKKRVDQARSMSFERLIFSSILFSRNSKVLTYASNIIGKQAIVGCVPFKFNKNDLTIFNSSKNKFLSLEKLNINLLDLCDELLIFDCRNEGNNNTFDNKILNHSLINKKKIIISGGVNSEIKNSNFKNLASILIENRILHKEYSIKK
tara:strand:+ start:16904 stop:17593 length:690 start_codon:yes stop_codon:yes gene_type:complete